MHPFAVPPRLALLALAAASSLAQAPMFTPGSVRIDGTTYPYQLLVPAPQQRSVPLPLVVFLHGAGERGQDNQAQRKWLPDVLAQPVRQQQHPCYVLAVQCPQDQQWVAVPWGEPHGRPFPDEPSPALRAVVAALDEVLATQPIDRGRVYLTGLSMGGYGAWDLASRLPHRFAALLAVCGGGDGARAHQFVGMPVAVYHGEADPVVPVGRSRGMVDALRQLGLAVESHELPDVGHDAWRQAYGERGGLDWLFQQDQRQQGRGDWQQVPLVPAPDRAARRAGSFRLGPQARCRIGPGSASAGAVFVAAMRRRAGGELALADGPAGPGDVEFRLDPALSGAIVLDAGPVLRITAGDADGLARGAVAGWQLLQSHAGLGCPAGTWTYAAAPAAVWLGLADPVVGWSEAQRHLLLDLCFQAGVRGITVGPAAAAVLAGPAGDLGLQLAAPPASDEAATIDVVGMSGAAPSLAELLAPPAGAVRGGGRLLLPLPALGPDRVLALLRTRLPAVVERQHHHSRPIHLGGFLGRLGCLLGAGPR